MTNRPMPIPAVDVQVVPRGRRRAWLPLARVAVLARGVALAAAVTCGATSGCSDRKGPLSLANLDATVASAHLAADAAVTTSAVERPPSTTGTFVQDLVNPRLLRRFRPIAQAASAALPAPQLVTLGRMLWYEPRLSRSGRISCNSCHDLGQFGVDHRAQSIGHNGQLGRRNAPTVYNAATHVAQFWDGRARDLEAQATGPILNPAEMASTPEMVEAALRQIPTYARLFKDAFPGTAEPVTLSNLAKALAAFERGLTTRSRWDDFLDGQASALSSSEIKGLRVFLEVGCMGCHTGPQVGASMFQVVGSVEPWPNTKDLGRFEITGTPADRMVFKVPTLKNVTLTGPYFHDGSYADLGQAVRAMGRHQLGLDLSDAEVSSIVAFLGAFAGQIPRDYIAAPTLPPTEGG